jgi:hypothetical protein
LFSDDKKPYVLITSHNQYWEVREGKIEVIKLNEFTPEEAVKFVDGMRTTSKQMNRFTTF